MTDSSAAILHWSGVLTPALNELSDSEIDDRYGPLMQRAVSAFKQDPTYVVEMAEAAAGLRAKRQRRQALRTAS